MMVAAAMKVSLGVFWGGAGDWGGRAHECMCIAGCSYLSDKPQGHRGNSCIGSLRCVILLHRHTCLMGVYSGSVARVRFTCR